MHFPVYVHHANNSYGPLQFFGYNVKAPVAPYKYVPKRGAPEAITWPPRGVHLELNFAAPATAPRSESPKNITYRHLPTGSQSNDTPCQTTACQMTYVDVCSRTLCYIHRQAYKTVVWQKLLIHEKSNQIHIWMFSPMFYLVKNMFLLSDVLEVD
jgi:hypothetical protein